MPHLKKHVHRFIVTVTFNHLCSADEALQAVTADMVCINDQVAMEISKIRPLNRREQEANRE